jgi:tRNA(Ile)-lysidine synthase
VTCSASAEVLDDRTASPFRDRVFRAFDIVAGEESRLGLAVSGGSDSTALLMLAREWAGPHRTLHVATVDHGLRAEAAEEARQAAALCARLGLPHQTLAWRPDRPAAQADARAARHRLLAEWAKAHALPAICLGHTRDDRIETFLIRARAGSHWRGLAGPMPSAPSPVWPEGEGVRLARPLLAFGRQALRDDLVRRAIPWIEDPSNAATKYERVRMRRLAARLDEATQARIVAVMDRLAELRSAAAGLAREALANHVHIASSEAQPSEARLDAAAFRSLSAEARLRLVEALVMAAGHAGFPPEPRRLERLAQRLALPGGVGAGATLAGAWVRETGAGLRFRPAPPRRSAAKDPAPGFSLARATALLGDPRIAAFRV